MKLSAAGNVYGMLLQHNIHIQPRCQTKTRAAFLRKLNVKLLLAADMCKSRSPCAHICLIEVGLIRHDMLDDSWRLKHLVQGVRDAVPEAGDNIEQFCRGLSKTVLWQ